MGAARVARNHFRFFEALGLFILLCSWLFNSWSIEKWNDAYALFQDKYKGVESMMITVQTMNVIRHEGAIVRQAQRSNLRPQASFGKVMETAWGSSEVRQHRVVMTGLIIEALKLFIEDVEPLIANYAPSEMNTLKELRTRVEELRKELHRVMPAEKDMPLTQSTVPDPSVFTLKDAENLDEETKKTVTLMLEARQRVADHIFAEKQKRTSVASWFFIIGSMFVSMAKVIEWRKDLDLNLARQVEMSTIDERQTKKQDRLRGSKKGAVAPTMEMHRTKKQPGDL